MYSSWANRLLKRLFTGMLKNKSLMGMLNEDKFFDNVNCMCMYEI